MSRCYNEAQIQGDGLGNGEWLSKQVKAVMREFLLTGLRQHGAKNPDLKATMVSWAIAGAALQWSRKKKTSADELANAVLPTVHTALQAGE